MEAWSWIRLFCFFITGKEGAIYAGTDGGKLYRIAAR